VRACTATGFQASRRIPPRRATARLGRGLRLGARLHGREAERVDAHDAVVAEHALRHHYAILCAPSAAMPVDGTP